MSDVIAKNELKNFDGYEFDSYEDELMMRLLIKSKI